MTATVSWGTVRETPRHTYLVAGVAAIGGMLFGYDIGVISGAENLLKAGFHLSSATEELAVAAVLIGAVIGGVIGGPAANRFSRRYTLLAMGILYGAGAILTAVSWDMGSFLAFRIITGVAVGASSLVVPAYIAEMSPAPIRGGLVILQQLAISGGILISYVLDFAFDSAGWGWRPMFAAAVLPAAVLTVGMLRMSHSPRWLAMRGRWDEADAVLRRGNPRGHQAELELLRRNIAESEGTSWRELLRPGMRGALVAGVGLAVFQQFVGPNTVLFYTPTIFGYAGVGGNSLLPTIYVGAALFVFVFPTIAFVDVVGRKALFYLGLAGMGVMLVLLGAALGSGASSWGAGVLVVLLVYVACYSLSISPLFWLMSAEVFPNRLRGAGASAATVANWGANLLVSVTFLSLINAVGKAWTFWIYAMFAGLAIVFTWRFVPETKGRPLEHIDRYWTGGRRWPG
ncbi:MAG: sugar porter family MFS transporter [Nocardiopsaceae bacterium]|nr:sugar porter family MFS transporter [Nocardiopsaceae bacterium]